ncbi:hypothetical protein [Rhizobium johnstonii]|uniref:hypothetical protein n=1 Tax=Rhizobium johnstonii TaxID=3019933 RepID=UPI002DDD2D3D|nr:hypothetical protein U8P72_12000 [Rhizobium johnstonii]
MNELTLKAKNTASDENLRTNVVFGASLCATFFKGQYTPIFGSRAISEEPTQMPDVPRVLTQPVA